MMNNNYTGIYSMIQEHQLLEIMAPLVTIIRDREAIFIELLSFVNRNIESSSNDLDQIYIFSKFLEGTAQVQAQICTRESEITRQVAPLSDHYPAPLRIPNSSKEMMRLSGRLLEILEMSVERVHKSLFGEKGKLSLSFSRFKMSFDQIIKIDHIDLSEFTNLFISFSRNKYRRQVVKLRMYLKRLESGDHISLKQLYSKDASDTSVSPDSKSKSKGKIRNKKSPDPQPYNTQSDSPHRKVLNKKHSLIKNTKTKRTLNLKAVKKEESLVEQVKKPTKAAVAAKLLKYYNVMEITKKQFLEDYIFEVQAEEEQRKKLMTSLIDRNKQNSEQIKQYYQQYENCSPIKPISQPSSGDDSPSSYRRNISTASKMSFKTSFIISKRKPSFTFQSPSEKSDVEFCKDGIQLSRTIKNLSSRKRQQVLKSSQSRPKPPPQKASKKIFVAKSPMLFQDQIIPKAEISTRAWIQTPLTGREKARRNENIRLKRQSNPSPLDESTLGSSFHFTQYPL